MLSFGMRPKMGNGAAVYLAELIIFLQMTYLIKSLFHEKFIQ